MKTPLATLNLWHYKMRTLAAVAGVTFSVVLVFMQLGFLGSVVTTSSLVFDVLDFDVLLRSARYLHVGATGTFPEQRLYQAASVPGVRAASPVYLGAGQWLSDASGQKRRILVLGMRPEDRVFLDEEMQSKAADLVAPEFVLIDRKSRHEFGPRDGRAFGDADRGAEAEVNGRTIRIVGHYAMGGGFAADGSLLVSERGFRRLQPSLGPGEISLGLVRVDEGADPEEVAARLREIFPKGGDVEVFTRGKAIEKELDRWVRDTSVGVIFFIGVVVALIVGTAIVYQVLSSDVASHLPEYATLKAMGYGPRFISGVVLRQAVLLALLGFAPGFVLAEALYWLTAVKANIPIGMTTGRIATVFLLAVGMCTISGLAAVRKLRSADPADLF